MSGSNASRCGSNEAVTESDAEEEPARELQEKHTQYPLLQQSTLFQEVELAIHQIDKDGSPQATRGGV